MIKLQRAFFSTNPGVLGMLDREKLAEAGLSTFNAVTQTAFAIRELVIEDDDDFDDLDEEDQKRHLEAQRRQAVHEIIRASHLSKLSMARTTDALADLTNEGALYERMRADQASNVAKLEDMMARERVRPSLLGAACPTLLSLVAGGCGAVLGDATAKLAISGLEKGMQDEHDEQLRVLNDKDLQEPELRRLLIEMRDNGFDSMQGQVDL